MRLLVAMVCCCPLLACTLENAPLVAENVVVTIPLPGVRMGAGYLSLSNTTSQTILITKVLSPNFDSVEMHESVLEDGISRMYKLDELVILPGQTVHFEPGGKHLMLRHPTGTTGVITLQFYARDALMLSIDAAPGE